MKGLGAIKSLSIALEFASLSHGEGIRDTETLFTRINGFLKFVSLHHSLVDLSIDFIRATTHSMTYCRIFDGVAFRCLQEFSTATLPHLLVFDLLSKQSQLQSLEVGCCQRYGGCCPLSGIQFNSLCNISSPPLCAISVLPGNPLNRVSLLCGEPSPLWRISPALAQSTAPIRNLHLSFLANETDVLDIVAKIAPFVVSLSLTETRSKDLDDAALSVRRPAILIIVQ